MSLAIHGGAIALLLLIGANSSVRKSVEATFDQVKIYVPRLGGGGGGGKQSPLPASKGALPRVAARVFVPPTVVIQNHDPKLPMAPAIAITTELKLPDMSILGDPLGRNGPPSDGPGKGGGIGSGDGPGVGPGKGPGVGPGEDGGFGGRLRGFEGAYTAPAVVYQIEPQFSEDARKAKLQGTVMLYGEVGVDGRLTNIRITRGLGLGLEEKAIEAVKQWRFRPASRNGRPVMAPATIEVNFHLL